MFINNNSRFCSLCNEKYHPQTFLEECKYAKENIKTKSYIDKEIKSESDTDTDTNLEKFSKFRKTVNQIVIMMNKFKTVF